MLYIVATPIGNLSDITFRAIEVLKSVDLILCEDTRQTKILLDRYCIVKQLVSYHQHSKIEKVDFIISELKNGKNIALVSDAGTPGISDPGNMLVEAAVKEGIQVVPIPGPSAVVTALSASGFPTDNFIFYGFMPHKKGKETLIKKIADNEMVSVFYESTHRIMKTLEKMKNFLEPERQIVVCRELTKKFETIYRGTVSEVLEKLSKDKVLGEFVVIIRNK
ncbi:MAG: Ribosomal RNA small subunit methyltransferase I [Parcubacteria group bacterium GW2011_GWA2_38_13]|nr:MAG: Ribosomal RNA small subunit methyltransferase I [Parcubacteria group bacterium GW2011_GWA2_38_13]